MLLHQVKLQTQHFILSFMFQMYSTGVPRLLDFHSYGATELRTHILYVSIYSMSLTYATSMTTTIYDTKTSEEDLHLEGQRFPEKQHKEFCAKFDAIVVTMEQDFLDEIILGADATRKRLSPRTRSIRT